MEYVSYDIYRKLMNKWVVLVLICMCVNNYGYKDLK